MLGGLSTDDTNNNNDATWQTIHDCNRLICYQQMSQLEYLLNQDVYISYSLGHGKCLFLPKYSFHFKIQKYELHNINHLLHSLESAISHLKEIAGLITASWSVQVWSETDQFLYCTTVWINNKILLSDQYHFSLTTNHFCYVIYQPTDACTRCNSQNVY